METEQKGALIKAYLGKSKDSLDAIDLEIDIKDSVSAFGPFIKFIIGSRSTTTTVPGPSVFEVLMSAQRITSLPKRIENAKMSKKDNLYNAVLEFLAKEKVEWNQFDVDGVGIRFVSALVDTLWYIDGHHQVFEKQGLKIPDVFPHLLVITCQKHLNTESVVL